MMWLCRQLDHSGQHHVIVVAAPARNVLVVHEDVLARQAWAAAEGSLKKGPFRHTCQESRLRKETITRAKSRDEAMSTRVTRSTMMARVTRSTMVAGSTRSTVVASSAWIKKKPRRAL